MNQFKFIPDTIITSFEEDKLNRTPFAKQLKSSLSNWNEDESLVISLKGRWGEGKSSVISLVKLLFKQDSNKNKPTIIEFNPWIYSGKKNISSEFFKQISSEIALQSTREKDKNLIKNLTLFNELINVKEEQQLLLKFSNNILILLGILGISFNQIFSWIELNKDLVNISISIISSLFIIIGLLRILLSKYLVLKKFRFAGLKKTVREIKEKIISDLKDRDNKLLIIIDDIDRLPKKEICEVFKLVRLNADFPNTIYLLAYDNEVIIQNLEEQNGISGSDYLKKIVQVDFSLPYVHNEKIYSFLFDHLDKILELLPNKGKQFFNDSDNYWPNCFNAGFKKFFENIRDVKRYYNSLLFNINLLVKENSYEVNPIDFFCIEAIRVFSPEFYNFIKSNKTLFTEVNSELRFLDSIKKRTKEAIDKELKKVDVKYKDPVQKIIIQLFPHLDEILNDRAGSIIHYTTDWRKNLRICSQDFFDAYFTLVPGGNEGGITQFEIDKIIATSENLSDLETYLNSILGNGRIKDILLRIHDFADEDNFNSAKKVENIIVALLNIADNLSSNSEGAIRTSDVINAMRIINQLLRLNNKKENYKTLNKTISQCTGTYGPIYLLSIQKQAIEEKSGGLILVEDLKNLQKLTLSKVDFSNPNELLKNQHFVFIIHCIYDWGFEKEIEGFLKQIKKEDNLFITFCEKFMNTTYVYTSGERGRKAIEKINFKFLDTLLNIEVIKNRLNEIKKRDKELYETKKPFVDKFFEDMERYKVSPDSYNSSMPH